VRPPAGWAGRHDGPGPEHARWHALVQPWAPGAAASGVVVVGFACDEGVHRNLGRIGATGGPTAIRRALGPLAAPGVEVRDAGDAVVATDLEAGQAKLGAVVAAILEAGALPVVLGGGHEVAFASYLGWSARLAHGEPSDRPDGAPAPEPRWGILNLDAHFDLRDAPHPTSGTPFLQAARAERAAGRPFRYAVVGVSRANNTRALFDTAAALGVTFLDDAGCEPASVVAFVDGWLAGVDRVHLSIDLDVLPASVAPGVSAPAGFGIGLDAVRAAVRTVAASGKLGLLEVAELNPRFDSDDRTARVAARLVDEAVRFRPAGR